MTIYIVEGSTGEYSDHIEWPVAAYHNEEDAKAHVLLAQARANELNYDDDFKSLNEYDPGMQVNYTGTRYRHYPIELRDRFIDPRGAN